jgi:hypothetical protein
MVHVRKNFWLALIGLALIAAVLAPEVEAADQRLMVEMDEPFEVAGQLFAPGKLTLRQRGDYSPVATLNEVCVDRGCLGLFIAQAAAASAIASQDELIFTRSPRGHLVLVAVALQGEPSRELLGFREASMAGRWVGLQPPAEAVDLLASTRGKSNFD